MKTMIIAAAAGVLMSTAASGNAPSVYVDSSSKAHIRYADLDLESQAGRDTFANRVRLAARMLCTVDSDPLTFGATRTDCVRSLIASGESAMNVIAGR